MKNDKDFKVPKLARLSCFIANKLCKKVIQLQPQVIRLKFEISSLYQRKVCAIPGLIFEDLLLKMTKIVQTCTRKRDFQVSFFKKAIKKVLLSVTAAPLVKKDCRFSLTQCKK